MAGTVRSSDRLRIVAFHIFPFAYQLVSEWVARHDHDLVLLVTTPGPASRRNAVYRDIIAQTPPEQDVIVTTRMRRLAATIAPLSPDLIISFTFPYRLPAEILTLPRLGAVNLHPTLLPQYRGPNPLRALYDGAQEFGATLHWTAADFDTGAILSQHARSRPANPTLEQLGALSREAQAAVLEEGLARAIAGDPGRQQDETQATYAARFTPEDRWLDWNFPKSLLQCRALALTMAGHRPRGILEGVPYALRAVQPRAAGGTTGTPGAVLARAGNVCTIAVSDGAMDVTLDERDPSDDEASVF